MLKVHLPPTIERRLSTAARTSRVSKERFAREAIMRHFYDIEDLHLAKRRMKHRGKRVTLDQIESPDDDEEAEE